jgi:hypothetical protein
VIGFLVWGDVPTIGLLVGSGIVIGSGLFLLWHETRRRSAMHPASSPAEHASEQDKWPELDSSPVNGRPSGPTAPPFSASLPRQ